MKYNMDQVIVSFNGEPMKKSEVDDSPVKLGETLQMACINANTQTHSTGEAKLAIYRILQKVSGEGEVELEAGEVTLIKTLVGDIYGVGMVGPVYDILEQ